MDDATQKLVAEARSMIEARVRIPARPLTEVFVDLVDALDTAQRPTISPEPYTPEARALIEGFVQAVTPMVTNETHAWNLWNFIATDRGAIREALSWKYARRAPELDPEKVARWLAGEFFEGWWTEAAYKQYLEYAADLIAAWPTLTKNGDTK